MYELPEKASGDFSVRFKPITRPVKTWKDELFEAARKVARSADKRMFLAFSGGIDSELMCDAFFEQGWGFNVLTIEHSDGGNQHDVQHAQRWCRERGITQEVVRLDVKEFFRTEIPKYADQGYIALNSFRYFQIKILELAAERDGYAVLGGGEQHYNIEFTKVTPTVADVHLSFDIGCAAPLEWARRNNQRHEPYFYFTTPELCLSYLQLPLVQFATTQYPEVFRNFSNRHFFTRLNYQTIWPALQPRHKYSGFESVADVRNDVETILRHRFKDAARVYQLPVVDFTAQLKGA